MHIVTHTVYFYLVPLFSSRPGSVSPSPRANPKVPFLKCYYNSVKLQKTRILGKVSSLSRRRWTVTHVRVHFVVFVRLPPVFAIGPNVGVAQQRKRNSVQIVFGKTALCTKFRRFWWNGMSPSPRRLRR